MNKFIIVTTIQRPTEAIEKLDHMKGWTLIVAGDLKTPKDYKLANGIYVSPREQEKYHKKLSDLIGWNNHARRNFGCLWAKDLNAEIVACVDDDNIPLDHWGKNLLLGKDAEVNYYETQSDAFDPIGATNYPHLWHRGFPLQLVHSRSYDAVVRKKIRADIQADFWNGDPDIDAVGRMIFAPECVFDDKFFPMASNKPSPFNSQNTFISSRLLPHFFLLPHLSPLGRQSDIWLSYHLASLGFQVVYGKPSVLQKRNPHDLLLDMKDEFMGYKRSIDIVRALGAGGYKKEDFWPKKTCEAYQVYQNCFDR